MKMRAAPIKRRRHKNIEIRFRNCIRESVVRGREVGGDEVDRDLAVGVFTCVIKGGENNRKPKNRAGPRSRRDPAQHGGEKA